QPALRRRISRSLLVATSVAATIAIGVGWWVLSKGTAPPVSVPTTSGPQAAPVTPPTLAPRLSLVMLPSNNPSNDPEQAYFAAGITDDLTTDLSRIAGSFVIARNTAFTYKGKPIDSKQIGRDLGIRYVLEGSVRRAGEQVRVNAQLIDTESGAHLWADHF